MKGFSKKQEKVTNVQSIINESEVVKLIKKYKKLKKFKKSNIHTINKLDGREDIIQKLVNEYMENNPE
jgi:DNA replicative helicase MCM subunit Mcm2 (Cdc46/Mcm family)